MNHRFSSSVWAFALISLSVISAVSLGGCDLQPPPNELLAVTAEEAAIGTPVITMERIDEVEWWDRATFRLANGGSTALEYSAYTSSPTEPLFTGEEFVGGEWKDIFSGWCGTGLESYELPPGKATTFQMNLIDHDRVPFRVSVNGVWSDTIDPPTVFDELPDGAPAGHTVLLDRVIERTGEPMFRLSNNTDNALSYFAVSPRMPIVRAQQWVHEGWQEVEVQAPGGEARVVDVPARRSIRFYSPGYFKTPFRIGVVPAVAGEAAEPIWSARFDG